MKYHGMVFLLAALLAALSSGRAAAADPSFGSLMFSIEQHHGKADWVTCKLNAKGTFFIYARPPGANLSNGNVVPLRGSLTAQEGIRIFEEFEKLCVAAGEDRFVSMPPFGRGLGSPFFSYMNLHGKILELSGRANPPPPELTEFLRMLHLKLLDHLSKNPSPPASSGTPLPANIPSLLR